MLRRPDSGTYVGCDHRPTPMGRECGEPAKVLILADTEVYLHTSAQVIEFTVATGACEAHAPEEVHEARQSMAEDEFIVVTLP